jgi:hypothetical protein
MMVSHNSVEDLILNVAEATRDIYQQKIVIENLTRALEALKHADGCYCEAAFAPPGTHVRHTEQCEDARFALEQAQAAQ